MFGSDVTHLVQVMEVLEDAVKEIELLADKASSKE